MKLKLIPFLAVLALLTLGCKKTKLTGEYAVYAGTWTNISTVLELNENGRGNYTYSWGGESRNIDNGRVIIDGKTIKLKVFTTLELKIDTPPTNDIDENGLPFTFMTLDGEMLIKE